MAQFEQQNRSPIQENQQLVSLVTGLKKQYSDVISHRWIDYLITWFYVFPPHLTQLRTSIFELPQTEWLLLRAAQEEMLRALTQSQLIYQDQLGDHQTTLISLGDIHDHATTQDNYVTINGSELASHEEKSFFYASRIYGFEEYEVVNAIKAAFLGEDTTVPFNRVLPIG